MKNLNNEIPKKLIGVKFQIINLYGDFKPNIQIFDITELSTFGGKDVDFGDKEEEIIDALMSLNNGEIYSLGDGYQLKKLSNESYHHYCIGSLFIFSKEYCDKFKRGGNQKLQKLLGEELYKKQGDNWWFNTYIICNVLTISQLKELTKIIKSKL
jgi:hypothetical protein